MVIQQNTEVFLGKPVTDYQSSIGITDPTDTIYRVKGDYDSDYTVVDLLTQFLQDPNVSKITGLIIGFWMYDESSQPIVELLVNAQQKLPKLTAIFLGDIIGEENEISWIHQSDISPLLTAYPQLEYLQVRGNEGLSLGSLNHDNLKTLIVESGGLSVNIVREVCQAHLPQLEHLELWLGDAYYGADTRVEDLTPILTGGLFPKLKYLGLRDSEIADNIATAVAITPLISQIKVLDLSLGNLGDIGAAALLASPHIHQLEKLDLHHHFISAEGMEQLGKLNIEVDIRDVQEVEIYDDQEYRYVAVSE